MSEDQCLVSVAHACDDAPITAILPANPLAQPFMDQCRIDWTDDFDHGMCAWLWVAGGLLAYHHTPLAVSD